MRRPKDIILAAACGLGLLAAPAATAAPKSSCAGDILAARQHSGIFSGRKVQYSSCVEAYNAQDETGKAVARLVAISYIANTPQHDRPVLFAFNGGPISASAILHMGALGPKRVAVPDDITVQRDQFRLADNPHALLDVADIVFFDPAGTGLSEVAPQTDPVSQFSVTADARQLQQLVLGWTRAHGREGSPIYLLGESYGTLRAPAAAQQLALAGRAPAGLILIGQAVNIIEYAQRPGNIISYAVSLPTLAATAWWHGRADRRGRSFEQFIAEAQVFGGNAYLTTLYAGDTAPHAQQEAVARELEAYTGISSADWLSHKLRISKTKYQRMLFPGDRLATNDARYRGPLTGPDAFSPVVEAYQAEFSSYLRSDLGIATGDYKASNPLVKGLESWNWGTNKTPFGDWPYGDAIGELMKTNPTFRLFVANGYYDTQTTIGAMDYLVSQGGWPRERVRSRYYQGGHMAYSVDASLTALTDDIRDMLRDEW